MCQILNIWNVDVYLYHENPLNLRGEMGNGPLAGPDPHGPRFTSPLRETDHDLDSASLDRDPDAAFPAFNEDH